MYQFRELNVFAKPSCACKISLISNHKIGFDMTTKGKKRGYKIWTKQELEALRRHARAKTPVPQIAKEMKRSGPTIRMKAYELGFSVGHRGDVQNGADLPKKRRKRGYKLWTADDVRALRQHSRTRTPVRKIAKEMKRTEATLRMKAYQLGFPLGHRDRRA
jgi:hypothetical protein